MDIKGVLNAVIPPGLRGKERVERTIKSDSTTDRDGNGQMPSGGEGQQHPPMSEEQLKKSMEHLQAHSAVKENNLSVELLVSEGKNFVVLKDPSGKIIRRIAESELWQLRVVTDSEKGQLLRKTA